jgi:phosphoribosyl 1,2-cyclic phosphodiesterase
MTMTVRFWGVRGSIPSPGPDTALVGGNTSCVEVTAGSDTLILDAGTGLRALGSALLRRGPVDVDLLLSHPHWDHIQGLPFFAPLYQAGTRLQIHGAPPHDRSLQDVLAQQMSLPVFPVRLSEIGAVLGTHHLRPGERVLLRGFEVTCARLNHPGDCLGYRLERDGQTVVYATDTEHRPGLDQQLLRLSQGADVLIYDAQFSPEEYVGQVGFSRQGWGHSTFEEGARLATAAGVGQLILFHHDPARTDAGVTELETRGQACFPATLAAREGLCLDLSRPESRPEVARAA